MHRESQEDTDWGNLGILISPQRYTKSPLAELWSSLMRCEYAEKAS